MQYECTMYSGRAPAKKENPCYPVTHLAENHGERGPYKEPKTKQNVLETVAHFGWTKECFLNPPYLQAEEHMGD
jgi:hypothetical protein